MYLGMLIGLAIASLIVSNSNRPRNYDRPEIKLQKTWVRLVSLVLFLISTCGAVGWILEVFL